MKHFNKLVILFMTLAFMAAAITGCKGAVTPQDNTTIEDMTIDVTPENIVNTILTLPASRTLKATGNFDSTTISNINAALKTLYQTSPSILVRLDLSATTGLTYIEGIYVDYYASSITINEEYKNKAFIECKNLETIILPESVTSIGNCAFYNCTNLAKIVIPDSVTSIGSFTFSGCTGLTSITIPDSVTSIGSYSFSGCTGLTSITIPDSVTSIGSYSFSGCTGMKTVYYTGTMEQWLAIITTTALSWNDLDFDLYINNTKIEGSITIPDSVTSICSGAFLGCRGITSITIPDSVTSIGFLSFWDCTGIKTVYYTGTLEQWLSINMDSNPCMNGAVLYLNNTKLEGSITIPNSFTSIGSFAFTGCIGLTSITIPDSVTSIGSSAFEGCTELKTVYYSGTLEQWLAINMSSNPCQNGAVLYLNNTKLEGSITIPDSVTSIGSYAFYGCTWLTSITIPDSVTSIGTAAFSGCTGLTSITIPDSVTSIDGSIFSDCTGLTSITIPDSVTSIGYRSFGGCTGLTSITIPNSVTSIGWNAFSGCTGLTNITIPDSVTSIGDSAFYGCTGLTSVTFKNTNGWKDSNGNPVSVADPEAAATLLKQGGSYTRSN